MNKINIDKTCSVKNGKGKSLEARDTLRDYYKQDMGNNWVNSQGEPDIDYVLFLEDKIKKQSSIIEKMYESRFEPDKIEIYRRMVKQ